MRHWTEATWELAALVVPVLLRETLRGRRAKPTEAGRSLGGLFSLVILNFLYLALLGLAVSRIFAGVDPERLLAGAIMVWGGALLRLAAYRALGRFYAGGIVVQEEHRVVATGPYRILRHPLHLGLIVEMTGLALVAGGWPAWALAGVAGLVLVARNLREERLLGEHLGADYESFRRQTWDVVDLGRLIVRRRP